MYWDPRHETMDREELLQLQLERLQATLTRVSRNVPFYRSRFEALGFDPDDLRSLDDLAALPCTTKADLRDNYPYGLFATPLRDVVRLQSSSGVTGKPVVTGYTRNDLKRWADLAARVLTAGGVGKDDVVQIAYGFGLFTGGFGFNYGAERVGAAVIPSGAGNSRRQITIMQDYRATALVCTPSYALRLADALDEAGVNASSLCLKRGLFGAEPWSEPMRRQIEERLRITATDNYGLSELMGPGLAGECLERAGMHVSEDHFLIEVADPESLRPVAEGEVGELVVTTLTREAFPLVRFRTGDLTRLLGADCPCGRTLARIDRIMGRTDDMIIIKGVNVFPVQIETVLLAIEGAAPHFQAVLERRGALDEATLMVEATESLFLDRMREQVKFVEKIERALASELGVSFKVRLVEPSSLSREGGKVRRVIDNRRL